MRGGALAGVLALALLGGCGASDAPIGRLEPGPVPEALGFPDWSPLDLRWELGDTLPGDGAGATVFVHLLDSEGHVVRTFDHPFPAAWGPGIEAEEAIDLYQSALGPPLPEGPYALTAGLVSADGTRLPLDVDGEDRGRYEYVLGSVEAVAPTRERFRFEGGWQEVEAGADRQVLARRWLTDEAELLVEEPDAGATVLLWIEVPGSSTMGGEPELVEGEGVPELRVNSDCSDETTAVSGAGRHRVEVELGPTGGTSCTVVLDPNFAFEDPARPGVRLSVRVDAVAYRRP